MTENRSSTISSTNESKSWSGSQVAGVIVIAVLCIILVWNAYHPEDVYYHDLDYDVSTSTRYDPREDVSRAGVSLQINDVVYSRGIAVHAPTELNLRFLPHNYSFFLAEIGLDSQPLEPESAATGSVIFRVIADGTVLYESPLISRDMEPIQLFVPIRDRNHLILQVSDAGDGNEGDDAIWAVPRFVYSL